jgi:hypothetical protein
VAEGSPETEAADERIDCVEPEVVEAGLEEVETETRAPDDGVLARFIGVNGRSAARRWRLMLFENNRLSDQKTHKSKCNEKTLTANQFMASSSEISKKDTAKLCMGLSRQALIVHARGVLDSFVILS